MNTLLFGTDSPVYKDAVGRPATVSCLCHAAEGVQSHQYQEVLEEILHCRASLRIVG